MIQKRWLTHEDVRSQCLDLAQKITKSDWKPHYVVGLTRGGLLPAVMLSHWFGVRCETLKVSLRDDGGDSESNFWMAEDAFGFVTREDDEFSNRSDDVDMTRHYELNRKNILVVDDINDSGATINWIKRDWQSGCLPDDPSWRNVWHGNVRFAVLVNNLASTAKIDYAAMEVNKAEKDLWIEFPWENWWMRDSAE